MEYCTKCGSQRSDDSNFCPNCGNEFVAAAPVEVNPPAEKKDLKKKPVVLVAMGVGLSLIVGLGVWAVLPKATPLTLTLSSKDDVTFANDCRPQMTGGLELADAIKVSYFGAELEATEPEAIQGSWSVGSSGECVFNSSISFPSGAENYSIELDNGSWTSAIANKLAIDSGANEIQISSDVTRYKTIEGSLTLFVDVQSYTFRECINSWAFVLGSTCGSLQVSTSGQCSGAGGYGDINSGTVVRVLTENNQELGIGKLSDGKGATILDWDNVGGSWETTCEFKWSVEVPEVETDYRVTISDRGERSYSYQEMSANKWAVDLSLGQ